MTESTLDRLAKAVFSTNYHPDDGEFAGRMFDSDDHPAEKRRAYRVARAVLNTLKEPDEETVEVGVKALLESGPMDSLDSDVQSTFTAMISHILKESESNG